MQDLKCLIRNVPDFPKKGIGFKDITTVLQNPVAFKELVDTLAQRYRGKGAKAVVCAEARGLIIGSALAYAIGAGVVPVRKKGKLPYKTLRASYDLEYGTDTVEIHEDALRPGDRVIVVDDLLATGGTIGAVLDLVKKLKAQVLEVAFFIELSFLKGREKLKGYQVFSIVDFDSE